MLSLQIWKTALSFSVFTFSISAHALESLSDDELSDTSGQALVKFQEFKNFEQPDGSKLDFTRITFGGVLEMNANIERVTAGRYNRKGVGWDCSTGGKSMPCGGKNDSSLYQTGIADPRGEGKKFKNLPGSFFRTPDADIQLRNLSVGMYDPETGEIVPAVAEDPFLEFAWQTVNGERQMVALRSGQRSNSGAMGNIIDVITGIIQPYIHLGSLGKAQADFAGERTPGFMNGILKDDLSALGTLTKPILLGSAEGQLRPVEYNLVNNAQDFFISISGVDKIKYPAVSPELALRAQNGTYKIPVLPGGISVNMAYDPKTKTGVHGFTGLYKHPSNYPKEHPIYQILYGDGSNVSPY